MKEESAYWLYMENLGEVKCQKFLQISGQDENKGDATINESQEVRTGNNLEAKKLCSGWEMLNLRQ